MDMFAQDKGVLGFGSFRIDPSRRCLYRDDKRIKLTPRLFDTLLYLVENAGRVVEKDELMQAVWGGRVVEEANLSQTVFALRKVLREEGGSEDAIATAPGRGYRFVATVNAPSDLHAPAPSFVAPVLVAPDLLTAAPIETIPQNRAAHATIRTAPAGRARLLAGLCAVVLATACLALWWTQRPHIDAAFAPPPHSVAVLAFANMSGDPSQAYFSDGVSEELINALSRVDTLQVAARTSSFSFRDGKATVGEIGRKLNVGAVLEGSVRRENGRIRISAELIDAVSGYTLWTRSYDSEQSATLRLQDDIASSVTEALRVRLAGEDAGRLTLGGTQSAAAFDAFLRGVHSLRAGDEAGWVDARKEFDQAIAIDPDYAEAHAARAKALEFIAGSGTLSDPAAVKALLDQALAAADKAVSLAPDSADAHAARATVLEAMLEFSPANQEIEQAARLGPGNASVQLYYGQFATRMGNAASGEAAVRRGVALDPLATHSYLSLGTVLYLDRHYDEALTALQHLKIIAGHMTVLATDMTASIHLVRGQPEAALEVSAKEHDWSQTMYVAMAEHALGHQPEADAAFARLHGMLGNNGNFQYAEVLAQWGKQDAALDALEAAYQVHDSGLDELRVDPFLDPLRSNPRFAALLQRMNFPI